MVPLASQRVTGKPRFACRRWRTLLRFNRKYLIFCSDCFLSERLMGGQTRRYPYPSHSLLFKRRATKMSSSACGPKQLSARAKKRYLCYYCSGSPFKFFYSSVNTELQPGWLLWARSSESFSVETEAGNRSKDIVEEWVPTPFLHPYLATTF